MRKLHITIKCTKGCAKNVYITDFYTSYEFYMPCKLLKKIDNGKCIQIKNLNEKYAKIVYEWSNKKK